MENLDAWFEARYQTLARKRPACRPAELLALLRRSLGQFEAAAPEPRLVSRTAATGHTREYWELSGIAGLRFGMYVLVPPGEGPFPGVLALHGHGYGNHEIVGLGPGGDPDKVPDTCHKHFALALVRRGLLVAAPAVIGFGERRFAADLTAGQTGASSCHRMATNLLLEGRTLLGLRVAEAAGALSWLRAHPACASRRTGLTGFSGGALIASVLSALDGRLDATMLTGFPNTFHDSIMAINHCIDNYLPGILEHAELPDLLACIAPRPLFLETGRDDHIFPLAGFEQALAAVTLAYRRAGAETALGSNVFAGGHEVRDGLSFDWLARHLEAGT